MVSICLTMLLLTFYFLPHFCVKTKIECGYKQCPVTREGTLNVHVVPHSHMDAGWVKTFDEYYYGTRASVSTANVQLIYHSVLSELLHDKRRKFTFSETAYFWRWWKEQRPNTRATFRSLVQEGRVEFAGGGWTHADSATVGYLPVLDMWTWGLRKLNDTLGPCGKPKAAWQIDTYGHTREHASLLAQMGFDGLFLGRVDHREREAMMEEDRMEFMWRGSDILGKMSDIMSHTLFNLYNAPDGFCFDFLCSDEPIVDDPDTKLYNADKRVNDFIAQIERQAKYYNHDNIMVTMGGDFTYQSASNWFMNIDKLINHVNTHPANMSDINIFYSTPSCYLKAIYLYGRRDKAIHTEKGDHLPYGSDATTYWTGFYTSRPSFKYLVRKVHVFSQIVKQLSVIAQSSDSYELHFLRHATGLVLHHDAITGTSQQHVINDFTRILSEAVEICTKKASNLLSYLTPTWGFNRRSKNSQQFVMCHQINMSQCRFAESQDSMLILVYNPLSVKTYHYIRLPAIALHYSVRDFNDEEVEYQMVPLPSAVINLPGRSSTAIQELCFEAENIPAMGYSAYFISPIRDQLEENEFAENSKARGEVDQELVPYISNEYLKVTVDKSTGLLESVQHVDGVKIRVSQNFFAYSQHQHGLQSGAYSFRPEKNRPAPLSDKAQFNTIRGALVKEIRQRFSDWVTQVIRLYRGEEFVELEWVIGPVPIGTDLGKEVVSIFTTNISSSGEFYTDSNGRQMMKRTCWNETTGGQQTKKPVPSCYYPVTSRICIKSTNTSVELCILPDRSQGGTSYNDGEIELMIHRRLLTDDGFGLEEPLNEEAHGIGLVVRGKHRIIFGNYRQEVDDLSFSERVTQTARKWELEPWLFFTSGDKITKRKWQNIRNKRFSALRLHGLPRHIHILTLEPWKGGSVLLRLENTLEKGERGGIARSDPDGPEDPKSHITVELRKIFLQLRIKLVRETTLGANQWLEDARQMDWSTRYVYNGGEDGILAEDRVEDDDQSTTRNENKDSGIYSEEQYYVRKPKVDERTRTKRKNRVHNRKKRATNETVFTESTTSHQLNLDEIWTNKTNFQFDEIKNTLNTTSETTTEHRETTLKNYRKLPKKSQKSTPVVFGVERQRIPYFEVDEVTSSEESFSPSRKKASRRHDKSHKNEDDIIIDDSDDGLTKSIYDMYYKAKPKQIPQTKKKNSRTEQYSKTEPTEGKRQTRRFANSESESGQRRQRKRRNENDSEEVIEPSTRTKNRNRPDMPFIKTERNARMELGNRQRDMESTTKKKIKRRGVSQDYYEYDDVDDDDDDDDDNDDKWSAEERLSRPRNRWKRSPKEDARDPNYASDPEPTEPDYIVTLRPTQIRTFIVWFDGNKRVYSL